MSLARMREREFRRPCRGGVVLFIFPTGCGHPPCGGIRFTRGYIPSPLRGGTPGSGLPHSVQTSLVPMG